MRKARQQKKAIISLPERQAMATMSMLYLPEEIFMETLSRLPVKSLLRFRCVSKNWRNLIDDPHFISKHLNHSPENNPAIIFHNSSNGSFTVRYQLSYETGMYEFAPFRPKIARIAVVGSCNGIVCLRIFRGDTIKNDTLCIWNPATRELQSVPEPRIKRVQVQRGFRFRLGFGFDSIHKDFKVVRIVHVFGEREVSLSVYSLRTGEWTEIGKVSFIVNWERTTQFVTGAFVNGAVHWINSYTNAESRCIISFDLALEKLREIPEHDYGDKGNLVQKMKLGVLGGDLSVIDIYLNYGEIWVMKDYGVKESWIKMLNMDDLPSQVIEIQSNGEFLMDPLFKDPKSVVKRYVEFDQKSGTKRYIEPGCLWYWPKLVPYVESLVPLGAYKGAKGKTKAQRKRLQKCKDVYDKLSL